MREPWVSQGIDLAKDMSWRGRSISSYSPDELVAIIGIMGKLHQDTRAMHEREREVLQLIARAGRRS